MDRGIWQATVHGIANSQTWLSHFYFHRKKKKKTWFWFERPLLQTGNSKTSVLTGFIPLNFLFLPFPLGNPMDRGAWWDTGHGGRKSQMWLRDYTTTSWLTPLSAGAEVAEEALFMMSTNSLTFQVHYAPNCRDSETRSVHFPDSRLV